MATKEMPSMTKEEAYRQLVEAARVLCDTYAIAVFTPDELQGVEPNKVERAMIEKGFSTIEVCK